MSQWHGGKGSAPRKQQDKEAYDDGWDRIFGRNKVAGKNFRVKQEIEDEPGKDVKGKALKDIKDEECD